MRVVESVPGIGELMGWIAQIFLFMAGGAVLCTVNTSIAKADTVAIFLFVAYDLAVVVIASGLMLTACLGKLPW